MKSPCRWWRPRCARSASRRPSRRFHPPATPRRLLADHRPTHLVSIERPGRTASGDYLSARGETVRPWNAPVDALFLMAPRRVATVGVGDGGNEIGMGNVRA